MASRQKKKPADPEKAALGKRLDDLVTERDWETKRFYDAMGWDKSMYSRKTRGISAIQPQEWAKAAKLLHAPRGWPHITSQEGMLLEAVGSRAPEMLRHLSEILALLDSKRRD